MIDITKELVWKAGSGQASDEEMMAIWHHACKILKNQYNHRTRTDEADPILRVEDLEQETWLKLKGWCKSFPKDGDMTVDHWFRVCWRNVSVNLSEHAARRRPRKWKSLEYMLELLNRNNSMGSGTSIPDVITKSEDFVLPDPPPNLNEIWHDLCLIIDHTPMDPKVKSRMKRFMAFRLLGYSVVESTRLVHYRTDLRGEVLRLAELDVITKYLEHRPPNR